GLRESTSFLPPGREEGIAVVGSLGLESSRAELLPSSAGQQRGWLSVGLSRPFELEVTCTDLSYRPDTAASAPLRAVLTAARSSRGQVIVGADFNLGPRELGACARGFHDALAMVETSWPMVSMEEFARAWRRRVGDGLPSDFDATPRRLDHLLCLR